eukprot:2204859-Rhodomonas_salina.2
MLRRAGSSPSHPRPASLFSQLGTIFPSRWTVLFCVAPMQTEKDIWVDRVDGGLRASRVR